MGANIETIFDIGNELEKKKREESKNNKQEKEENQENLKKSNEEESKYKSPSDLLFDSFLEILTEREVAKYNNSPITDTNKNKADLEILKIVKKEIIKDGIIGTLGMGTITIGAMTFAEILLSIDDLSVFEEIMSNSILMGGGIFIGANLFPHKKMISEAKEIEKEIYEENPELKPVKKPRRLGAR